MKVLSLEDLTKAAGGLGGHFGKASAFHKSAAAHHEALHKHHAEMASFSKGKHDAMDDGHEMKAYMGKAAAHHEAKAAHHLELHKLHKTHGEECDTMKATYDADKVAGTGAPATTTIPAAPTAGAPPATAPTTTDPAAAAAAASDGLKGMIDKTTAALVAKSLESLNSDPTVAQAIQKMVLEQVQAALGNKLVPTDARAFMPTDTPGGSAAAANQPHLVPRPGQPVIDTTNVPPEFKALVEA